MKIKILFLAAIFSALAAVGSAQTKTPTFKRYAAKVVTIKNIKVNLKSHKTANMYRTNLRNAAKEGVNFAGHFVLATWGCGTDCSQSAVVDARGGRVFFPEILDIVGISYCDLLENVEPIVFKADSRLLVLSGFKGGDIDRKNAPCGIYYFVWTGTDFKQVKFEKKKRIETP